MTTDKAQNIKLEDRDPEELRKKLDRVVELVTAIKGNKANIVMFTKNLTGEKADLIKNQAELKDLEKEVLVKVRKPRALKPALKTPVKGSRKTRKDKGNKSGEVIPPVNKEAAPKLSPTETAPGDPRQAALPIDKK